MIRRNIPNAITCGNLLCGCLALVEIQNHNLVMAAIYVGIAAVLDFFDGFAARMLKVSSPIGKDLDSLADMVTFGVVPGVMIYKLMWLRQELITNSSPGWHTFLYGTTVQSAVLWYFIMNILPLSVSIFSAVRLAKFNNDSRQSESFIGLPTPANAMLICSIPLILTFNCKMVALNYFFGLPIGTGRPEVQNKMLADFLMSPYFLGSLAIVQSFLLIAELPLFALKFKNFGWADNKIRYIFLGLSLILLVTLQFIGIPLIIVMYILLSVVNNLMKKSA